ncbi:MAG: hypothetical protein ACEQSF_02585 [Solirubrobacteraceae bacterium]
MNATFHFSSAKEISVEFLETIKTAYKEKSISITIEEDIYVPLWQKEEVLKQKLFIQNNPDSLLDFDLTIDQLEKDLASEG